MMKTQPSQPLSLYIHLPWCVRKCPYCDFNSHPIKRDVPEARYIQRLLEDVDTYLPYIGDRQIQTVFFGGGTPSLFSAGAIHTLLEKIAHKIPFHESVEITLEANPGTFERERFKGFRDAGVNRLSIGVQSFQDEKLTVLGRIHQGQDAKRAIEIALASGFNRINVDIMHGLPNQTVKDALYDLETATAFPITHLSWYQLTLEPDTVFAKHPPHLPDEETLYEIESAGFSLLESTGFRRYEISAFAKADDICQHNRMIWKFHDYIGIGAGAHGKLTQQHDITRFHQVKSPAHYMNHPNADTLTKTPINKDNITFEFMLNHLRLFEPITFDFFETTTGLSKNVLLPILNEAESNTLIEQHGTYFEVTAFGKRHLNTLMGMFLSNSPKG